MPKAAAKATTENSSTISTVPPFPVSSGKRLSPPSRLTWPELLTGRVDRYMLSKACAGNLQTLPGHHSVAQTIQAALISVVPY